MAIGRDNLTNPTASETFMRDSNAFESAGDQILELPQSPRQLIDGAISSVSDGAYISDGKRFLCSSAGKLWAIEVIPDVEKRIYNSIDWETFTTVGSIALADDIAAAWGLASGTVLLVRTGAGENGGPHLSRCSYSSPSWTLEDVFPLEGNEVAAPWGLVQAPHGTILFATYGTPALNMYRSADDGASFTTVKTWEDGPLEINHPHKVVYHSALKAWVVFCGDSDLRQVWISTDDGNVDTWKRLSDPGKIDMQPTEAVDVGHPTKLLCGSDRNHKVFWFDLLTKEVKHSLIHHDSRQLAGFCFAMRLIEGSVYAGLADNRDNVTDRSPAIGVAQLPDDSAQTDLKWSLYHRFTNNERCVAVFSEVVTK